ncbi:MAG: Diacylglycerol kinase [Candidatus Uhrbacteria bacterium GW2011_GWE2_46_68]|uniref:Diacylglycerol kinase n=2 Tax=Candidatus Uhriibacteriota TaxID=1752732 RepID=A0A0G1Q6E5_9BACT|nr:MAG: Diacylglycerol kinase [Candidatus Uhrbacteria bacterium GW2011_GWF2_46_218]KKU40611.1 MAG: Diacylglycerol kinase [Candidatus Uhrbacteria bacterium GW2011_GWE2_46_68]
MIHVRQFKKSFFHALRGIWIVLGTEQSFRLQVSVAIVVVVFAWELHVSPWAWVVLLLLIAAVLTLELLNSVFERIVDTLRPRLHPAIKDMKDMMAGVVLLVSLFAAIIGGIVFWPYLFPLFLRL